MIRKKNKMEADDDLCYDDNEAVLQREEGEEREEK